MVGDVDTCLPHMMSELSIKLTREEQRMNIRPLISLICKRFFGEFSAFVDLVARNIKSPQENAKNKIDQTWTGSAESQLALTMHKCDSNVSMLFLKKKTSNCRVL